MTGLAILLVAAARRLFPDETWDNPAATLHRALQAIAAQHNFDLDVFLNWIQAVPQILDRYAAAHTETARQLSAFDARLERIENLLLEAKHGGRDSNGRGNTADGSNASCNGIGTATLAIGSGDSRS